LKANPPEPISSGWSSLLLSGASGSDAEIDELLPLHRSEILPVVGEG